MLDEAEVKVSEEGGVGRLVLVQESGDGEDDSGGQLAEVWQLDCASSESSPGGLNEGVETLAYPDDLAAHY